MFGLCQVKTNASVIYFSIEIFVPITGLLSNNHISHLKFIVSPLHKTTIGAYSNNSQFLIIDHQQC